MMQYSLQHKITYWLRSCTPAETEEMVETVAVSIMEAVHAVTNIDVNADEVAKDILRLSARLKEGGVRSVMDLRRPTFLGAVLDILPRCIGRRGPDGEEIQGIYLSILT
jgi:hypothetical protein